MKIACLLLGFLAATAVGVASASHSADLNGDGKVDSADLTILKSQWGTTGIADLNHDGAVNARDAGILFSSWGVIMQPTCNQSTVGTNQLVGCLWDGTNFNTADGNAASGPTLSSPVPTTATALDINWGTTGPNTTVGSDTFSARWKGQFTFPAGTYTFIGGSDDGLRVRLNGTTKIDQWVNRSYTENSFTQTFSTQTTVTLEIDYYENTGNARVQLRWTPPAMGPLTVHPTNPRYFTYKGQPIFLAGADLQNPVCDTSYDYVTVFNQLKEDRINKVRIFIYCYWKIDNPTGILFPWTFSGGKFNLDTWDSSFWSRARAVVAAARDREIIIEVSIIPASGVSRTNRWPTLAWNKAMNVNGAFTTNVAGHFIPEFWDASYSEKSNSGKTIRDYQNALIDKTVAELGGYPNVYFEASNEFPGNAGIMDRDYPWQQAAAQRINAKTSRLVTVTGHEFSGDQTTGIQYFWNKTYIDGLNFHFYSSSPKQISNLLHAAQLKGKALITNESFGHDAADLDSDTRYGWGMIVSGGYFAFETDGTDAPYNGRLRAMRDIFEKVRFWEMAAVDSAGNEYDSLVSQGPAGTNWQVFTKPGSEYIIYFWGSVSSQNAKIQLPSGSYAYTWSDARNGATLSSGSVSSAGGVTTIAAPPTSWDANVGVALVIIRR